MASKGTTDSNSNPIGISPSTNTIVSTVRMTFAGDMPHEVLVIGEFSSDCSAGADDFVVGDIQVDGNTVMNTQVNNLNGAIGTIVMVSGVLTVKPGTRKFDLRAFTRAAHLSVHHRSLTVIDEVDLSFAGTVYTLDNASPDLVAGDWVCLVAGSANHLLLTKALPTPLAAAGIALGIMPAAAAPGATGVQVGIGGTAPSSVTGLGGGAAGQAYIDANARSSRAISAFHGGFCDTTGKVTIAISKAAVAHVASSAFTAGQAFRGSTATPGHATLVADNFPSTEITGVALHTIGNGAVGAFQVDGILDPAIFNLGAGVACAVGLDSSGNPVRVTDPACVSATNYLGSCDVNGTIRVLPRRLDAVDVKDFGAKGDGATDDTAAIQAALDYGAHRVRMPKGNYVISCTSSTAALLIRKQAVILEGVGLGTNITVNGAGTAILIEALVKRNVDHSEVRDLQITGGTPNPQDMIVVHATLCTVENVYMQFSTRFGVLVESGTVGAGGGLWGLSNRLVGVYLLADECTIKRVYGFETPSMFVAQTTVNNFTQPSGFGTVSVTVGSTAEMFSGMIAVVVPTASVTNRTAAGAVYQVVSVDSGTTLTLQWLNNVESPWAAAASVTSASLQFGSAFAAHGSDGQLCRFERCDALDSLVGFTEASLGGNEYANCATQEARCGYFSGAAGETKWDHCSSEDTTAFAATLGNECLIVGGKLASYVSDNFVNTGIQIFGGNSANLQYKQIGNDDAKYEVYIPGGNATVGATQSINFQRTEPGGYTSGFGLAHHDPANYPFTKKSWQWKHNFGLSLDADEANGTGVYGYTDLGSPFGSGCFLIGGPQGNTRRHWHWRQSGLSLASGANTVYLNGGVGVDGGAVPFCDNGAMIAVEVSTIGGTAPPLVTFSGTPTEAITDILIFMWNPGHFAGTPGTVSFAWQVNGGTVHSGVTMDSAVVLSGTGITVNFPVGDYANDNVWHGIGLWGNAQVNCRCHLEFDSVLHMTTAGVVTVNGVCQIQEAAGPPPTFNWAASINATGTPVSSSATLVWEFDVFVPNYASGSGNIG